MVAYQAEHQTLRNTFATQKTKSIKWRKWQLKQIWWMVVDNQQQFIDAMHHDLGRHPFESLASEINTVKGAVHNALTNIEKWAHGEAPEGAGFALTTFGKAWLRKEPLGVILIIGAFNFPLFTLLGPVIGAIAAGNCLVMKPSELATATQNLLAELVPKYLDQSAVKAITGGPTEVGALLELKWDHICYTGGSKVARIIAGAAAKHLTPVTLELGGQDPVIVGKSANVDLAAKRIAGAKFMNAGQICINANHIFVDPSIHDKFVERMIHWNKEFTKTEGHMACIINERHFDRITNLLKASNGDVVYGGNSDRSKRYIHPTVVKDVKLSDSLMSEELFAPIAPVISSTVDNAINIVNSMPHALALYVFSSDQSEIDKVLDSTTSGGACVNDVSMQMAVPGGILGGVGESGHGGQNGRHSFNAFSHTRTVLTVPSWIERLLSMRNPPFDVKNAKYTDVKSKLVGRRGQTMEEQTVSRGGSSTSTSITGTLGQALLVGTALAVLDRATGGKLMVVQTLKDAVARL